jgi:hypothetical protein
MTDIRIGIGLDVGSLVANAETAKSSLESLHRAMASSLKAGNVEDVKNYAALNIEARNQFLMDARLGGYSDKVELDTGQLQEHIKELEAAKQQMIAEGKSLRARQYGSVLKDLQHQFTTEQVAKDNPALEDTLIRSINSGDYGAVRTQLDLRKQYIRDARLGGDTEIKLDSGPLETVMRELKDAINRSISEGKTEDAKKYGSVLKDFQEQINFEGGGEERQKLLAQTRQMRLLRDVTRLMNLQNVIGQAGAGNVAGAAIGAAGGVGELIGHIPKGALIGGAVVGGLAALAAGANKLSEQWEKVMQPSMGLAASLGRLGDDAEKNHAVFQEVFSRATDRRVLHGYRMEEGIELASRLSKSGMAADNVIGGEGTVLRYQRMTDADRGDLAKAVGYAGRYRNNENVLGYAFGGVKESGMQQGQYQEYLNATLRIFEEGLSKGVVKGFAEITRAQNMLAFLGDTWKGEQGAERILKMEDAITGAGGLQSDYDVIMYRAAQEMMKDDGTLGDSGNYLDVTSVLEQGITAGNGKILQYVHEVVKGIADTADEQAMLYKRNFGLNTDAARALQQALAGGMLNEARAVFEDPSSKGIDETPEMKLLTSTEAIRADVANIGAWFTGPKANIVDAISKLTHIMAGDKTFAASAVATMDVLAHAGLTGDRQLKIDKAFERAYTAKDQPDEDDNGEGDYAQRARTLQNDLAGLPVGYEYWSAMNPNNLVNQNLGRFTRAEDFTAENARLAIEGIDYVKGFLKKEGKSEDDLKREYLQNVAASVQDDPRSREDDILRFILTNHPNMIPNDPKIMSAFEAARDTSRPGNNGAEISNKGRFDEIGSILTALQSLVPEFRETIRALRESNELVIRQE